MEWHIQYGYVSCILRRQFPLTEEPRKCMEAQKTGPITGLVLLLPDLLLHVGANTGMKKENLE